MSVKLSDIVTKNDTKSRREGVTHYPGCSTSKLEYSLKRFFILLPLVSHSFLASSKKGLGVLPVMMSLRCCESWRSIRLRGKGIEKVRVSVQLGG